MTWLAWVAVAFVAWLAFLAAVVRMASIRGDMEEEDRRLRVAAERRLRAAGARREWAPGVSGADLRVIAGGKRRE
jgi:predicted secreted protein